MMEKKRERIVFQGIELIPPMEVCDILHVCRTTLSNYDKAGLLEKKKMGGFVYYYLESVFNFLAGEARKEEVKNIQIEFNRQRRLDREKRLQKKTGSILRKGEGKTELRKGEGKTD